MRLRSGAWRLAVLALVVLGGALFVMWRARAKGGAARAPVAVAAVERQNIAVTIEATGTVEPIDLVEVKSKASGQILRMPVEVGTVVKRGDLLAQIDIVDVQNAYDQAVAALQAAQTKADISRAQKKRSDELFEQGVITAPEHESAALDLATAQSALVKARTDLSTARQRLEDATVRAPIDGTVLEQLVTTGQVISSATSSVSGGTSLLKMADLGRIRLRALVSESDIGNVHPGQSATVTVDAFPNRTFAGEVAKVEPQAVVQQSVTMFPVLISISNLGGLLMPGMNGEVTMLIDQRDSVLAVPVDAVRSQRELTAIADVLGLNADSVRADVGRQVERLAGERAAERSLRDSAATRPGAAAAFGRAASADSARARRRAAMAAGGRNGGWGGAGGGRSGAVGGFGAGANGGGLAAGGNASRAGRAQVVFVRTERGLEPRVVALGLQNFDYAQVLRGVKEGESVALLSVAELQAKRTSDQAALRQRMGSGLPGTGGTTRGARGGR